MLRVRLKNIAQIPSVEAACIIALPEFYNLDSYLYDPWYYNAPSL